ncbi:MAG: alkaline phosphatase family protein [Terriglobales bacterium]
MPSSSRNRWPLALVILAVLAVLTGLGLRATRPRGGAAALRQIHHVFVVMMENKDYGEVIGNPSDAPYLNQDLLPQAAYASQYFSAVNHGRGDGYSLPNYLWLVAGTNFGINNDHAPFGPTGKAINSQPGRDPLVAALEGAGISWRAYLGNYTAGCPLVNHGHYAVRHDPFVYFQGFTGPNPKQPAAGCGPPHLAPMAQLARDLQAGGKRLAAFNFIVPGVCDDMHDDCLGSRGWPDEVIEGDTWLGRYLPLILRSAAYRRDGAVFILWDEGNFHDGGPLPALVLSPFAKHGFLDADNRFNHSSALRTWCEIFGVAPPAALEAAAAQQPAGGEVAMPDLSALFMPPPAGVGPTIWFWVAGLLLLAAILTAVAGRARRAPGTPAEEPIENARS